MYVAGWMSVYVLTHDQRSANVGFLEITSIKYKKVQRPLVVELNSGTFY